MPGLPERSVRETMSCSRFDVIRIVLKEPLVAFEHVVPIKDRQSGDLDPPVKPAFLARVEGKRRRHFAAVNELRHDDLAVGSG